MSPLVLALCMVVASATWIQMEPDAQAGWFNSEWRKVGPADRNTLHPILIAMRYTEQQFNQLEKDLYRVSDPRSPDYGRHLSVEDVVERIAAPASNLKLVENYLQSFGVQSYEIVGYRDMITARVSVQVLEQMLNTKIATYQHIGGFTIDRVEQAYYLPSEIARVVSVVENLIRFPHMQQRRENVGAATGTWPDYCGSQCHGLVTPHVLQEQYKIDTVTSAAKNNSVAVAEFQGQYYDSADLDAFSTSCNLPKYSVNFIGTNKPALCQLFEEACIESLLDIEYIAALSQPIPLSDYYLSSYSLLDWAKQVAADPNAPWVHSVSYGNDEIQQTSTDYMYSCNTQFMALGSRGISVLFATGDQGVWGRSGTTTGKFNPDFPAGSPYITGVGGSDLSTNNIGPETCCRDSGGGFSNTFARPYWQNDAVTKYINTASLPPQDLWNATGRAYPDISAIFGLNIGYCVVTANRYIGVAGTSASCPVVAAMIAQLNNIRLNRGQAVLGYLNPWIYQTLASNPTAFNDITTGKNDAGHTQGFSATAGWDPCTGVGTPNFSILKTLV